MSIAKKLRWMPTVHDPVEALAALVTAWLRTPRVSAEPFSTEKVLLHQFADDEEHLLKGLERPFFSPHCQR